MYDVELFDFIRFDCLFFDFLGNFICLNLLYYKL